MQLLSVVLPAYNEEPNIESARAALGAVLSEAGIPYELVFVNDGSKDHTWEKILEASGKDPHVAGVRFSRNFGKESAIFAGLGEARGDVIAVMDCDLQHPPEKLPEMYRMICEGYDIIEGIKNSRGKESIVHKKFASLFYGLMSKGIGADMQNASDFKMMTRRAVESILSLPERNMFFRATSSWVGYRTGYVYFDVQERTAGQSKWSSASLVRYALTNIAAFSTIPLQFVTFAGSACFLCSLLLMVYSIIQYLRGHAVEGYTTLVIVILFIGSAIMVSLGIIGYYIAKIYEEVKHRPRYLISERTGWEENKLEKTDSENDRQ